ncbi:hypothetical protein QFC19_002951 [Naganishia cerealis]|uniref:Uncharacterized protein n=1 Tax=Naganishia cerealis TaxID=610337 RepID=A0ACC2W535_9TREE|nr:hypothetical protein QFC19_002951 [Naganishia cerealis]
MSDYPGAARHGYGQQQQGYGAGGQWNGGYGAPPPGPPPGQYNQAPAYGGGGGGGGGYAAEPPRQDYAYNGGGGGGYEQRGPGGGGGGWAAPTGQAIAPGYHSGSGGYNPANEHQYGQYQGNAPPLYWPQKGVMREFHDWAANDGCLLYPLQIGINYRGTSSELKGCINDAQNMSKFLCDRFGYQQDDIVMLVDDARHGGQTKDLDGDEDDGYDEVIYPLDFKTAGHIVDDDLHTLMVKPLPAGCRLTAIFDSCHSASALDLPYIYSTEGKIKEPNLLAEAGQGLMSAGVSYLKGDEQVFAEAAVVFESSDGKRDPCPPSRLGRM